MANHVSNYIVIHGANSQAVKMVREIFRQENPDDSEVWTADLVNRVFDNVWPKGEEDYDRNWVEENCGAKWFHGYLESDEEDYLQLNLESAWSPVRGWVQRLYEVLSQVSPDVWITNKFEDEGYGFAGFMLVGKEWFNEECMEMDEWEAEKFFEDDNLRDSFYEELNRLMEEEEAAYLSSLEDEDTALELPII